MQGTGRHAAGVTVIRLGAHCELEGATPRQRNYRISEFAVLDDGTEVTLHMDRGMSIALHGSDAASSGWTMMTVESLEVSVRTAVLPDAADEAGEEHPWAWLLALLEARGVHSTEAHLKTLPYEVRFGESVLA